ncbi:MAG: metal-dependent hydrolase [Acidaminobacteraceae bacterium]
MDPITHAVIGAAISAFSGQPVAIDNPVTIGAALGAMAPDLDFVVRLFSNDMVYLKQHRGMSHSIPFLALFSVIITAGLSFMFPTMNILTVFIFTLLGSISHTVFDILNSYGAMLLKKKKKLSLLTLYDPVISVLALYLIIVRHHSAVSYTTVLALFAGYLIFRFLLKKSVFKTISKLYENYGTIDTVTILPSLKFFYKWDFIVSTSTHNIVGVYNTIKKEEKVVREYKKKNIEMMDVFKASNLGKYFIDFSSNYHIEYTKNMGNITLKAVDLRYYFKDNFMHHGTLILDENYKILESYFQPYKQHKMIAVAESN